MKAKINGTEIYFDITGLQLAPVSGRFVERPVLFMLHGGPGGDHLRYKLHSLDLAQVAQLVFIDNRGSGRSKQTNRKDYNLENNIEDIEALRKYLGFGKISMLGTSYGGTVALGYALRYQKNLNKLICVAAAPSYRFLNDAKANLAKLGSKAQIKITEKLWAGRFKSAKELITYFRLMESMYSVKKHHPKYAYANTSTWSYQALNEGFKTFLRTYDFIPQLNRIKVPTLVLAGREDWICPPQHSKIIAREIPNSKLRIFSNCGHAIAMDAHGQYISAISRFLKK